MLQSKSREALAKSAPHYHAVRHILEREQAARGDPPRTPVELPDDPRIKDLAVEPHSLESYDELGDVSDANAGEEVSDDDR